MSAPNNDHVKLHPANLVALQKANYLFHCAHNCFLVPVVVVVDDFSLKKKRFCGSYLSLSWSLFFFLVGFVGGVVWFLLVLVVTYDLWICVMPRAGNRSDQG